MAVEIFDHLQLSNANDFMQVLQLLSIEYQKLWFPKEVEREFCGYGRQYKRRKRMLQKLKQRYNFIEQCPITVSENEIGIENNFSGQNRGETDAIIQAAKVSATPYQRYRFSSVKLFLKDKQAIKKAKKRAIPILKYNDFASRLLEVGIILPH